MRLTEPIENSMSWEGCSPVEYLAQGGIPVTMHIVLLTAARDGLVWITERSAFLGSGHGNFAAIEKVTHVQERGIAFSAWGDATALEALGELGGRVKDGSISLVDSDQDHVTQSLRDFANDVLPVEKRNLMERPDTRGLIVATLGHRPRVYRLSIVHQPVCFAIYDQATAGDVHNPANLFVRYYYPRCNKTVEELLAIGIHTMRLARELNSGAVGDTDAWACSSGRFHQLTLEELARYARLSESLDVSILNQIGSAAQKLP